MGKFGKLLLGLIKSSAKNFIIRGKPASRSNIVKEKKLSKAGRGTDLREKIITNGVIINQDIIMIDFILKNAHRCDIARISKTVVMRVEFYSKSVMPEKPGQS